MIGNSKVSIQTPAIDKHIELTASYQSNFDYLIEDVTVTMNLYNGSSLFRKVDYPIKLLKQEVIMLHTYQENLKLYLEFVNPRIDFKHALRIRVNKSTFFNNTHCVDSSNFNTYQWTCNTTSDDNYNYYYLDEILKRVMGTGSVYKKSLVLNLKSF